MLAASVSDISKREIGEHCIDQRRSQLPTI